MNLRASPNHQHLDAIRELLAANCPDTAMQEQAFEDIKTAIEFFRQTYPMREGSVLARSGISASRKEIHAIYNRHRKLLQTLEHPSPETISILRQAGEISVGMLTQTFGQFSASISAAKQYADAKPDKVSDEYRAVLARSVAKALQSAGIPVAATVPSPAITGRRGGAIYGRILHEACLAAGLGSVSLGPLIKQGVRLLNDPDLP